MVILFMLFLIQFSVACACLAVNSKQQTQLAEQGWNKVPDDVKTKVQEAFQCCGFEGPFNASAYSSIIKDSCDAIKVNIKGCTIIYIFLCNNKTNILQPNCCMENISDKDCNCKPCMKQLQSTIDYAFKLCGGIGLFFSFTEVSTTNLYNIFITRILTCALISIKLLLYLCIDKKILICYLMSMLHGKI